MDIYHFAMDILRCIQFLDVSIAVVVGGVKDPRRGPCLCLYPLVETRRVALGTLFLERGRASGIVLPGWERSRVRTAVSAGFGSSARQAAGRRASGIMGHADDGEDALLQD